MNFVEADNLLEDSVEEGKRAVDKSNNLDETVSEKINEYNGSIEDSLEHYKVKLSEADSVISEGKDIEEIDHAAELIETSGQHLVNAYAEASVLMNKMESAMYNGARAFESDVSRMDLGKDVDFESYQEALRMKNKAFELYDQKLDEVAEEYVEKVQEEGLLAHIDVGLDHQQPEY